MVTPAITIPVSFTFYQPAPTTTAHSPHYPTKQDLALRLLGHFKAHQPTFKGHCITADALSGTATFVDGASALFGGVQVLSQLRSNQNVRLQKREQHIAAWQRERTPRRNPEPAG